MVTDLTNDQGNCVSLGEFRDLAAAYLCGEISVARLTAIEEHVLSCSDCATTWSLETELEEHPRELWQVAVQPKPSPEKRPRRPSRSKENRDSERCSCSAPRDSR